MSVKEKLKKYLKVKGIKISDFEKSIEASNGYVNSISKGIGGDKLEKIRVVYPDLDIKSLLDDKINDIELNIIHNDSVEKIMTNEVQIPYYDADFSGGWGSAEIIKNMKPSFFITSPDFKKAEFACNLVGHSISRRIPSGAVIGMREIFEWQTYFPTNEIYGVVLKNDLRTVKIIKRSSTDKNILILMPDPLDLHNQTEYEPEEVPIDFVVRFYQIVAWAQFEKIAM